ncbi:MAG: thiamine diphosphokinase [Caldicoprobacterales bacterium]|jgi:thiamine pyrophosphokinase|nr:thiamine diphosphokinase [Clostridiales bacterium]
MRAVVVSNGELGETKKLKSMLPDFDLVVCCDGGIRHLESLGLFPDLIVGDFDSVDPALLDTYQKKGVTIRTFPIEKNETDTELAVQAAVESGAEQVVLLGALGSRWDHSYANIMVLVRLMKSGIDAAILHSHNRIVVSDDTLCIEGCPGQLVSLLPLGENVAVHSTTGLKYPISDQKLPLDTPYGISNIMLQSKAKIQIKSGWLMAIIAED